MNQTVPTSIVQPAQKRMTLASVTKSKRSRPVSILLYGTEGVGKSTFASDAPSPIFLCPENGISHLNVDCFPSPTCWADVIEAVDTLLAGGHPYKTLVIDTVDWLEPLAWAQVVAKANKKDVETIEDIGYGKGYIAALDLWRSLLAKLERLREKGMHVILLGHASIKVFANPEGENFDRYELKLNKGLSGLLKEWTEAVLFATYEIFATKLSNETKVKGVGSGARIVRTERRPAFDAKNRYQGMPFEIPLSWDEFWKYAEPDMPAETDTAKTASEILALASGTEHEEKVKAGIAKNEGNAAKLASIMNWLQAKLNEGVQ